MTKLQVDVFKKVFAATSQRGWYRAARSGERVTLASLYRANALVRRPWRGVDGAADTAYEYRVSPETLRSLSDSLSDPRPPRRQGS